MNTQFQPVTPDNFTRVDSDVYGNPRYVLHFTNLTNDNDRKKAISNPFVYINRIQLTEILYNVACKRANKIGGRKYRAKHYGGGIVFQSYSLPHLCERINALLSELN